MNNPFTIFYADDDRDDVEIFAAILDEINAGHELHTQRNGQELLNALQNPPPEAHVIFLDLNMPVKNGYEVLSEIRSTKDISNVPIVVFSTSDDDAAVQQSKDLGANLYITKPGSYEVLKRVLKDVLSIDWANNPPQSEDFVYIAN